MRKVEKFENFKKLKEVNAAFCKKDDTVISLFDIQGEKGAIFTGEVEKICEGFRNLILDGIGHKDDVVAELSASIAAGIQLAIEEDSEKGEFFRKFLLESIVKYNVKKLRETLEEDDSPKKKKEAQALI